MIAEQLIASLPSCPVPELARLGRPCAASGRPCWPASTPTAPPTAAPRPVHAVLARHGLNRLAWIDRPTGEPIRHYERERPGELLHMDIKKLGKLPDGGGWLAHGRGSSQHTASRRAGTKIRSCPTSKPARSPRSGTARTPGTPPTASGSSGS